MAPRFAVKTAQHMEAVAQQRNRFRQKATYFLKCFHKNRRSNLCKAPILDKITKKRLIFRFL